MELIQNILVTALLGIWACLSIGFFVWLVQGIEIEKAKRKGQLIRYFTENCEEVHR